MHFWYTSYGEDAGTLNVHTRSRDISSSQWPEWRIDGDQHDNHEWRPAAVAVAHDHPFAVVFEHSKGIHSSGGIALDDVRIDVDAPCPPAASCTFEHSLCLWRPVRTDSSSFHMSRVSARQLASLLPRVKSRVHRDVTTNGPYGHFLWTNKAFFAPHDFTQRTFRMRSETLFADKYSSGGACFRFSYLMSGREPGTIQLLLVARLHRHQVTSELFSAKASDRPRDHWLSVGVEVPTITVLQAFELHLVVTLGNSSSGDIAIDDLLLLPSPCASLNLTDNEPAAFDCGDGTSIRLDQVCDWIADCADGADEARCADCDFESQLTCQYADKSAASSAFNWTRSRAGDHQCGPLVDHTFENSNETKGHYMLRVAKSDADADFLDASEPVVLALEQLLQPTSSQCQMQLFYHIRGESSVDDDELLQLTLTTTATGGKEQKEHTLLANIGGGGDAEAQGDEPVWRRALVRLGRVSQPFRLEFVARSQEKPTLIALDDLKMLECSFPVALVGHAKCHASDEFQCEMSGACVPVSSVCDLTDDCGDASDEENCSGYVMCDFEDGGMCNWRQRIVTSQAQHAFAWTLRQAGGHDAGFGRDHTIGLAGGNYLSLAQPPKLGQSRAPLFTPLFKLAKDSGE